VSSLSSSLSLSARARITAVAMVCGGGGYGVHAHAVVVADREGAGAVVCAGPAASGGRRGERQARWRRARLEVGDNPDMWGQLTSVR